MLGTPTMEEWPEGYKLASNINFTFPKFTQSSLSSMVPGASPEAIDLMHKLLAFKP